MLDRSQVVRHSRQGTGNALLDAILESDAGIDRCLERVPLSRGEVLAENGDSLPSVWWPQAGMVSLLVALPDGKVAEGVTIGREGLVGADALFGDGRAISRIVVHVSGHAARIGFASLRSLMDGNGTVRGILGNYMQSVLAEAMQSAACNAHHSVEQRCARWLLAAHDRVGAVSFELTQEFLAEMLGVRRSSVTVAAGRLQDAGIIRYSRGSVTIVDRDRLEAGACECYAMLRRNFGRLLP